LDLVFAFCVNEQRNKRLHSTPLNAAARSLLHLPFESPRQGFSIAMRVSMAGVRCRSEFSGA